MATLAAAGKGLAGGQASGQDFTRGLVPAPVSELPPYAQLLQCRLEESDGETIVTIPFHDDVIGRPGYLHGGAIAGLLEIAAFTVLAREIGDPSVAMKPITVTVDYMRPAGNHETHASAVVQRLGASIANVEAFAWQADRGEPVASARLNFLFDRPTKLSARPGRAQGPAPWPPW